MIFWIWLQKQRQWEEEKKKKVGLYQTKNLCKEKKTINKMKMQPMESGKTFVNYISNSVSQSCLTLCNPMDCSPPGSPVHGILQARLLEWVAIPFSRGSSWPRDQIQVSHIAGRFFIIWAIRDNLNCIKNSYYSVANKLPKQSHKIGRSDQTFFQGRRTDG